MPARPSRHRPSLNPHQVPLIAGNKPQSRASTEDLRLRWKLEKVEGARTLKGKKREEEQKQKARKEEGEESPTRDPSLTTP